MKTLKERFEEVKNDPTVRNSKECETVEEKIRKKKEIPFSTVEDVISKFCKEDLPEEARKLDVKGSANGLDLSALRKNRAEDLRAVRELHDLRKKAETQLIIYNRYGR